MPDVIEKKSRYHDNLAVTVNDAAPCWQPKINTIYVIRELLGLRLV